MHWENNRKRTPFATITKMRHNSKWINGVLFSKTLAQCKYDIQAYKLEYTHSGRSKKRRHKKTGHHVRLLFPSIFVSLQTNIHYSLPIFYLFVSFFFLSSFSHFHFVVSFLVFFSFLQPCAATLIEFARCIHQENTNYIVAYEFKQSEKQMEK